MYLGKVIVLGTLCTCIRGDIFLDTRAFAIKGKGRYGTRAFSKATINEGIGIGTYDTSGVISWTAFRVPYCHPVSRIPGYVNRNDSIKNSVRELLIMTIGTVEDAFRSIKEPDTGTVFF